MAETAPIETVEVTARKLAPWWAIIVLSVVTFGLYKAIKRG